MISHIPFLRSFAAMFIVVPLCAQTSVPTRSQVVPLGLPRLKSDPVKPGLAASRFTVDDLKSVPASAGVVHARRGNDDYVALAAGKGWSRPLRGSPRDVTFVSFLVYGSLGTTFDIGGAKLSLVAAYAKGHAQLMVAAPSPSGVKWRELGYVLPLERFGGAPLAELPVLTVRVDSAAGEWDIFAHGRAIATNLPLADAKGARTFAVQAGSQGAWVCGFVTADDSPLFEDVNANGIDDDFERSKRGSLLANNASPTERKALAAQSKEHDRRRQPKVWIVRRPTADRFPPIAVADKE